MAYQIVSNPIRTDSGDAYTLAGGDELFVKEGADIVATEEDAAAIRTTIGAANVIAIHSSLTGDYGIASFNPGSVISIAKTGIVAAGQAAISISGQQTIYNAGTLTGATGITCGFGLTLFNTGTIRGGEADNSYAIYGSGGSEFVVNSGVITGTIELSSGDDRYLGTDSLAGSFVRLGNGQDVAVGGRWADTFEGGRGDDTIDGGGGSDTAVFSGMRGDFDVNPSSGTITIAAKQGGDGIDTLTRIPFLKFADKSEMLWNAAPDSLNLSTKTLAETAQVNTPVLSLAARDADGDALTYSLLHPSGTFRLDGNSLVLTKGLDYEAGARQVAVTLEAKDAYGGRISQAFAIDIANVVEENPLTLFGTTGKDALAGENGSDKFYGGLGNDTLTGHLGQDVFVFDAKLAKTSTANKRYNLDKITDFSVADDTIHLKKSIFKGIAKTGLLSKDAFYASPKSAAHDASDRIIYNKNTGAVLYDQDGSGHRYEAIQIATLSTKLGLTNKDFFVI